MAYAAMSSLMHTLERLLQSKSPLIYRSCIQQQHVESAFQSLSALQVFLEDTSKEIKDIETLKIIEKWIRDIVYKAEERVDSTLRRIIILKNQQEREQVCKSFNEELQKVEKEADSLRKELMEIEFVDHGSKSAEASTSTSSKRYATEQHTVVGMKDDFNTILDRLTAQTDELIVIPVVGMGGIERLLREGICPPHLDEIGKHIIDQCRGLPLSIVVVAGLLGKIDPTRDNWKKVEENLNSFFGTVSERCQSILSLSYSFLPQHLKACFLYVGCFPEDMEIGVSKLIKLWIAELFVRARSNKRLEMVAEEYLEELIDRSLILAGRRRANGRMKTCKIHDLLRQLCIREAQIENFVLVLSGFDDISIKNYQRRAMLSLDKLWNHLNDPSHLSCITSTTSSLIFTGYAFRVYEMPLFVYQFKLLKVLDISSVNHNFSWVISVLVHLRYVAANIDEAPSLVKLWNLQTIILRNLSREDIHLPQEIWTMSEIRHLDIRWSIHMPNPLEAESHKEQPLFLNNLQTLFLSSSPFLAEILRRTPNLKKLQIVDMKHTNWPAIFDSLILLRELETLAINAERNFDRIILPRDIFLPNLKQLRLSSTYFPWEDMVVLANLPNLEVLKTRYAFRGTEWRLNEDVVFHKLKYLRIESLYILKRWEASSDNFPILEQLLLFELPNLEEIPQSVGEIMTLKFIQIHRCSSTAVTSAMKIQEEQTNCGNDSLEVRIINGNEVLTECAEPWSYDTYIGYEFES